MGEKYLKVIPSPVSPGKNFDESNSFYLFLIANEELQCKVQETFQEWIEKVAFLVISDDLKFKISRGSMPRTL